MLRRVFRTVLEGCRSVPLWGAVALAAILGSSAAPAQDSKEALSLVFQRELGMTSPNSLLAVDLVHTPDPELVITDVKGRLGIYDALTGKEMDGLTIGAMALTAPAVGDFRGEDTLDIVFGTSTGKVVVVDGTSLSIVAEAQLGSSFGIAPTVVTLKDAAGKLRDRVVMADQDGTIRGVEINAAGSLVEVWKYSTGAKLLAPLASGSVRKEGQPDVIGPLSDGNLVLVNPTTGQGEKLLVQQGTSSPVSPLLADVNQDYVDEIILTLKGGETRCLSYVGNTVPPHRQLWSASLASPPVGPPTLLRQGNSPTAIAVLQITEAYVHVLDARTGQVLAREMARFAGANTQALLIPRPDAYPEAAFGLRSTLQVTTSLGRWVTQAGTITLSADPGTVQQILRGGMACVLSDKAAPARVVAMSPEAGGHLYIFETPHPVNPGGWPTRTPWMTSEGTSRRNSVLDRAAATLERDRRERLAQKVTGWKAELQEAEAKSDWDKATDLAARLVEFDPYDDAARAKQRAVWFKRYLLYILLSTATALLIGGYTTFKVVQFIGYSRLRRRAELAFSRGDFDESRRFYQRLYSKVRTAKVAVALARVFEAQRDYSAESLPVYERAHKALPEEQDLLHGYARALLLEPKTTPEAAAVYEKALSTFPEPQLLEYGLGRCAMAAGDFEEAGKRLRAALRGGVTTDALYAALCDVYLRTKNFTAKSLPVFQQQFPGRQEDREFLEGYLAACIDAKKTDQPVESLCQQVLEVSPGHVPAYMHLAVIFLQKGQVGAAIEEVRQALNIAPTNDHAISMLAHCYLVQNRRDEEALQAFRRALAVTPSDRELLRVLAGLFFDRGQFDEEAVRVYHRSVEENPGDVPTLRALAQTAQLTGNFDLAIRSIEALGHAGHNNPKLTVQLATAYVRRRVQEPKAEKVLREALRIEPNNVEFASSLSYVLAAQDRTEIDCIPVYEAHLATLRDDVVIGRQLAKTFIKANRYEAALSTAQRFLNIAPGDEELQRLSALASLYDNKIDEAVTEYRRMLERNPKDPEALVNLALAYGQKMKTDDEAFGVYQRALAIQPHNDLLQLAMARVMIDRNDTANAVEAYKRALKARDNNEQNVIAHMQAVLASVPEMLRIRWFLVEVLVSCGHLREALEQLEFITQNHPGQEKNVLRALETILAKDPNQFGALLQRGTLLLATGQPDEAARVLEKANQLRPNTTEVYERLVRAFTSQLERKDSPEVRFKLGRLFFQQQEYDAAIGCFQKTAQDYRWEAESTKMLGKCFTGKGMLDIALQEFKKLVVDAETKDLLYDLAQRYEAKKDLVGAKTVYRQLFAADIDFKDVKTRFEMLSGQTSDPMAFEKTSIVQQMSEEAARRYELLDELGRGAMGIVYRARDKELDEIVALKILPDNMSNNPEAVRRFKIEARNARKLSHPNIVRIHDIGEEMGRKYISMEYVDGSDLKKKIRSSPDCRMPLESVIKYQMAIADALGYAHRLGIVHRDIKPANIMLTSRDDVKVTDFGIAKMMDQAGEGTMMGAVIGTPLYMSPEQVQGVPVDNRADIYAYGIMFYEMLNGRPPFTEGDLAYQHIHREPTKLDHLPEALWQVVAKCLAKKKEQRWDNAEAIYEALKELRKAGVV